MIWDIIYWLFFIWMWAALIKYRKNVKSWTWNFVWAEHYLGRWWTYAVILFLWLFFIFYWVAYPFWWVKSIFIEWSISDEEKDQQNKEIQKSVLD